MNKNTITTVTTLTIIILIIVAVIYFTRPATLPQSTLDTFAQCLSEKNLTMYGAEWCPHCQREKALFGTSFKYVKYVECPDNAQLCIDKGITGYPTWIDSSGTKHEGEQGLEGLSKISGCPLSTN